MGSELPRPVPLGDRLALSEPVSLNAALKPFFCAVVKIKQDNVCRVLRRALALSQRLINGAALLLYGRRLP